MVAPHDGTQLGPELRPVRPMNEAMLMSGAHRRLRHGRKRRARHDGERAPHYWESRNGVTCRRRHGCVYMVHHRRH